MSVPEKNLNRKYVFIIGAPRSGTTWLQLMLACHPDIGTCQETHLFDSYLAPMERAWKNHAQNNREIGLQATITYDEFIKYQRSFALNLLNSISDKPIILEKTPAHIRVLGHILKVLPEAQFIHIIRDPRAVVNSLVAASKSWAKSWASTDIIKNTELWLSDVENGIQIGNAYPQKYIEIYYEELLGDVESEIARLFDWTGLEHNQSLCEHIKERNSFSNLSKGASQTPWNLETEPSTFFRRGIADSWRTELKWREIAVIEHIAREKMESLGYNPVAPRMKNPDYLSKRIRQGIGWRLCKWGKQLKDF